MIMLRFTLDLICKFDKVDAQHAQTICCMLHRFQQIINNSQTTKILLIFVYVADLLEKTSKWIRNKYSSII